MKQLTINVTQEDIDKGNRNATTSCPVARAINRATKDIVSNVSGFAIELYGLMPNNSLFTIVYREEPTKAVKTFIKRFDSNQPVKPFSFVLNVTDNIPIVTPSKIFERVKEG